MHPHLGTERQHDPNRPSRARRIARALGALALTGLLLGGCAYKQHLSRGDKLYSQGKYEEALKEYEAAREVNPEGKGALRKIEETKGQLLGTWTDKAKAELAAENYLAALELAGKLMEKLSQDEEVKRFVGKLVRKSTVAADGQVAKGEFAGGLAIYDAQAQHLPAHRESANQKAGEIRELWAKQLEAQARAAEKAKHSGDALLLWAKAAQMVANDERNERQAALRAELVKAQTYTILPSIQGRGGADVLARLTQKSGPALMTVLPAGKSVRKPQARVTLKLRGPKFSKKKSTHSKSARYQSGNRQVENPSYRGRQSDVTRAERAVLGREEEVTKQQQYVEKYTADVQREGATPNVSTGAEQNLTNAKSRLEAARRGLTDERRQLQRARETLAKTQQFREEPVFSNYDFTVTRHHLTGTLSAKGTIKHSDGRPPVEIGGDQSLEETDDTHPPQPIAKVAEDPLTLADRADITAKLYDRLAAKTHAALVQSFEQHRTALLEKAQAESETAAKVDLYVKYVLTDPTRVPEHVVTTLVELRGIPDVIGIIAGPAPKADGS